MKLVNTIKSRRTITIELTPDDQDTLLTVVRRVGGPSYGHRGRTIDPLLAILRDENAQEIEVAGDYNNITLKG